jgi:hypothetical protein
MKKLLINTILVSVFALLTQSCKKTLEEDPKTFISPNAFFNSPESYEQAVKGIYATIPFTLEGNAMSMRETFSDIIGPPSPAYEQGLPTYQNNHQPFFYNVRDQWSYYYTMIKNANFIIKHLEESTILSDAQKSALTGEARFLRAFAFFFLVQFYGDIPMPTKPVEDYSSLQIDKSPQADVYNLIVEDLIHGWQRHYLPKCI